MSTPSSPSTLQYKFAIVSYHLYQSPATLAPNCNHSTCFEGHTWAYGHHHPNPTLKGFAFLFTSNTDLYLEYDFKIWPFQAMFQLQAILSSLLLGTPAILSSSPWHSASRYSPITKPWTGAFLSTLLSNYLPFSVQLYCYSFRTPSLTALLCRFLWHWVYFLWV